jgi:hypothetical protein
MAANVLNSSRAVEMSIFIVRAFVKMRKFLRQHTELSNRIAQLEQQMVGHDEQLIQIIEAIKQLLNPEPPQKKYRIGFQSDKEDID